MVIPRGPEDDVGQLLPSADTCDVAAAPDAVTFIRPSEDGDSLGSGHGCHDDNDGNGGDDVIEDDHFCNDWQQLSDRPRSKWLHHCPTVVLAALSPTGRAQGKQIIKSAMPVTVFSLMSQLSRVFTIVIAGQFLGQIELDAIALAFSYTNVFGLSIVVGLLTGAETLFSQAYGSTNKKRVGVILQQGLIILTMATLPLTIIFFNAERILLLAGQNPEVARLAGVFAFYNYFTLVPYLIYSIAIRYLITQGKIWEPMLFGVIGLIITTGANLFCVKVMHLGVVGVSVGFLFGMITYPITAWLYIWKRNLHKETWDGWSWECMYGWKMFVKLSFAGMLMICIEWWSYEATLLLSGVMGELYLGISVVMFQVFVILFMIPLGLGVSASYAIGKALGAGEPRTARTSAFTGLTYAVCLGITSSIFLVALRNYLPLVFSSCRLVLEGFTSLIPISVCLTFTDYVKAMYSGILRGVGRQRQGALLNFISYYVLAFPIGVPLAFLTWLMLKGIWLGFAIGIVMQAFLALTIIYRFDWDKESLLAQKRVGVEKPVLHQHTSSVKGRRSGKKSNGAPVALVSFQALSSAGDGSDDEDNGGRLKITTTAISLSTESNAVEASSGDRADDVVDDSPSPSSSFPTANGSTGAELDSSRLLDSGGESPEPSVKYQGRPRGRILVYRLVAVAICVSLCLLGVVLRVFVPLHRPSVPYLILGCPGEDTNVTMAMNATVSPPWANGSEALELAMMSSEHSMSNGLHGAHWYYLPQTSYRIVSSGLS